MSFAKTEPFMNESCSIGSIAFPASEPMIMLPAGWLAGVIEFYAQFGGFQERRRRRRRHWRRLVYSRATQHFARLFRLAASAWAWASLSLLRAALPFQMSGIWPSLGELGSRAKPVAVPGPIGNLLLLWRCQIATYQPIASSFVCLFVYGLPSELAQLSPR